MRELAAALSLLLCAPAALAQPNTAPGRDIHLYRAENLNMAGRQGTFPDGVNGLTIGVRVCNTGAGNIDWVRPMDPRHPFYGFILCRESNGRFEQISDRSFVKHGFSSTNSNGCGTCTTNGSTRLGPNCSDTYSTSLNANRFYLGPAEEIDPWLGAWEPVGSHFDRGEPNVGSPQNMDGLRSLTTAQANALGPVAHRVEVADVALAVDGARFYYGAMVVIAGELEALREDNMIAIETQPTWSAGQSRWNFANQGALANGSILQFWNGATVESNANGSDDGRFYVGVSVTGPSSNGLWHYEYAVHNRDNSRGAASLRIPVCGAARVLNASARDIDGEPANDWTVSMSSGEVAFLAAAGNALEWNTIYNFSFDSDAAPLAGQVTLDQARPGPGAAFVAVNSQVPGAVYNQYLGDGCGGPTLSPSGSPPIANIPNPSYGLQLDGLQPGATAFILFGDTAVSVPFPNQCGFYVGGAVLLASPPLVADPAGSVGQLLGIPDVAALEGADLVCQGIEVAAGGPFVGQFNLTNGLTVRVGNALTPCP